MTSQKLFQSGWEKSCVEKFGGKSVETEITTWLETSQKEKNCDYHSQGSK